MQDISGYFDWAATAPVDEDIIQEATDISVECFANPSSQHGPGAKAREKLTEARIRAANALSVAEGTLFFTSGGTEANHIPLLSLLQRPSKGTVLVSAVEHPAIREQAQMLRLCGWNVGTIRPDANGTITVQSVEDALTPDTVLVCVMAVNNETGAVQPVYDIADMLSRHARENGKRRTRLHVDCVQAAGKIPFNLGHSGIDSAAFSAHKIGGPRGIGLLYLANRIESFLKGGGQEQGIRSGTENLAGAWALSRCLERYYIPSDDADKPLKPDSNQHLRFNEQRRLTEEFTHQLVEETDCNIIPETRLDKQKSAEFFSPWILQASFRGIPGGVMVRALSDRGISISTGSACSTRKTSRPVLEAMGVTKETAINAVRFSFGHRTTRQDMDRLLEAIAEVVKEIGG